MAPYYPDEVEQEKNVGGGVLNCAVVTHHDDGDKRCCDDERARRGDDAVCRARVAANRGDDADGELRSCHAGTRGRRGDGETISGSTETTIKGT